MKIRLVGAEVFHAEGLAEEIEVDSSRFPQF
jgi:hypothetical protein